MKLEDCLSPGWMNPYWKELERMYFEKLNGEDDDYDCEEEEDEDD
jgi:hypothetical protein